VTEASDASLDAELTAEIAAAIAAVESLPAPARESLLQDVYAEPTWNLREQMTELARTRPAPTH
jgi:pyruvate dehydrogenase E1 component alpha subunit